MDRRPLTGPEKLSKSHRLDAFSCGIESLDGWLTRFAWINQQSDLTSTYVVLLARLAVDTSEQGSGLGRALLKDALLRAASAADIIAVRAVLVHALNDEARRFYMRFDFEPSPVQPLHLMLLMKDIRASGWQH